MLVPVVISATEPLALPEVKKHLGEIWDDNDDMITSLITTSREMAETYTKLSLVDYTLVLHAQLSRGIFKLRQGPVKKVNSVKYLDINKQWKEMNPEHYSSFIFSQPAQLAIIELPSDFSNEEHNLQIAYDTGWGDRTQGSITAKNPLPETLKQAMLMIIGTAYDFRSDLEKGTTVNKVPISSMFLMSQYRNREFF